MKVLIAGAGGAIGLPLIERLAADGHEVVGMTRSPDRGRAIRAAGAEAVLCDVLLERQLTTAVQRAQPEAIVHELTSLPAKLDPRRYAEQLAPTNRLRREGTRNLIAAARAAEVERVLAQSIAFAYAQTGDWIKDETAALALDAPPPRGEVVAAVAELERQVLDVGGVVLRYGHFYGSHTHFGVKGVYADLARKRQLPIVGTAEGRWSFVHVRDAADATALALERALAAQVLNVVDDEPAPAREWIPAFAAAVGAKRPLKVPDAVGARLLGPAAFADMTGQRGASSARARAQLGWTPAHPTWRAGFAMAIAAENRERWRWVR